MKRGDGLRSIRKRRKEYREKRRGWGKEKEDEGKYI